MLIESFLRTLTRYPKLARAGPPLGNMEQTQSKSQINRAFRTELHIRCGGRRATGGPTAFPKLIDVRQSRPRPLEAPRSFDR